jgi:hypothetical protein
MVSIISTTPFLSWSLLTITGHEDAQDTPAHRDHVLGGKLIDRQAVSSFLEWLSS